MQLNTTITRYHATKHITVLNLKKPQPMAGGFQDCLDNMHKLCVPKGKQLDHFVDKTVDFLRDPPAEPFCYRHMLKDGYKLQKVHLGTVEPEEKPENKRKVADSEKILVGSKSNPIKLKEENVEHK